MCSTNIANTPNCVPVEMIQALCSDYEYVGIIHSTNNQLEQIYVGSFLNEMRDVFSTHKKYEDLLSSSSNVLIKESEKDLFLFECRFDLIKAHLEKNNSFCSGLYEVKKNHKYYIKFKFVKHTSESYLISIIREGVVHNEFSNELQSFLSDEDFRVNMELEKMKKGICA